MRPHLIPSRRATPCCSPRALLVAFACGLLLLTASPHAAAQCFPSPTGETAVGLRNASSHHLLFLLNGMPLGGAPPGDPVVYFAIVPGEHDLRAEAVVAGETVSASRTAFIPEGHVCAWTVTDAQGKPAESPHELKDSLRRDPLRDFAGWRGRRL